MKNSSSVMLENLLQKYNKLDSFKEEIIKITDIIRGFKHYNKVIICGNGGSCSDSAHIVGEMMKSFAAPRAVDETFKNNYITQFGADDVLEKMQGAVRAVSIVENSSLVSAISNDIGGEYVFSQQVYGMMDEGDILIGMTTSGNSINIINAMKTAKAKGGVTVGFTGKTGGKIAQYCDILFNAPEIETFEVQQQHEILYHIICLVVENELFAI